MISYEETQSTFVPEQIWFLCFLKEGPVGLGWGGGGGGGRAPQVHAMLHAPNNLPERRRWMAEMMSKIVQLGDRKSFGKYFFYYFKIS